jgi:hypothetical protein
MVLGLKWMFALLIILISIPNIQIALTISWFAKVFVEVLPGQPLPLLTSTLITFSTFFCLLAFVWPILGLLNVFYGKSPRIWMIWSAFILFIIGFQLVLTYMGCFMPLFSGIVAPEGEGSAK